MIIWAEALRNNSSLHLVDVSLHASADFAAWWSRLREEATQQLRKHDILQLSRPFRVCCIHLWYQAVVCKIYYSGISRGIVIVVLNPQLFRSAIEYRCRCPQADNQEDRYCDTGTDTCFGTWRKAGARRRYLFVNCALVASGSGPPVGLDVIVSRVVLVVGKDGTSDGLGACEDVSPAIVQVTPVVLRVVVEVVRRVE